MTITAAVVLYGMLWFLVLFMVLPTRLTTQGEARDVVRGTPASAPTDPGLRRKLRLTTLIVTPIWAVACAVIISGVITVRDIDVFNRMRPASGAVGETDG